MNAKITPAGLLQLERAGKYLDQQCPFTPAMFQDAPWCCGAWCPLFEELLYSPANLTVFLNCAPQKVGFDHVIDERPV